MLPDLSNLTPHPRGELKRDAASAIYCLDKEAALDPCASSVLLQRGALPAAEGEFDAAVAFMQNSVRQDSFMGNPVPRKQCTFGDVQYKNYQLVPSSVEWPKLVQKALDATRAFAAQLGIPNPEEYTGVHANYYPTGDSSVAKHADDEIQLVKGAPIFSFTYLAGDNPSLARDFTIWRAPKGADHIEGKGRLADVTLQSGDLLIMQGDMQRFFYHSIEKQARPVAPRINLTVRKFVSKKEAMARLKAWHHQPPSKIPCSLRLPPRRHVQSTSPRPPADPRPL